VGHQHHGYLHLLLHTAHQVPHLGAQRRIESGERFVKQERARPADERAGYGDALSLPARYLGWKSLFVPPKPEPFDHRVRPVPAFDPFDAMAAVQDVLFHGHVREEGQVLEHVADGPLRRRKVPAGSEQGLSLEPDHAGIGSHEARDRAERKRLAGPGTAEQHRKLVPEFPGDIEGERAKRPLDRYRKSHQTALLPRRFAVYKSSADSPAKSSTSMFARPRSPLVAAE